MKKGRPRRNWQPMARKQPLRCWWNDTHVADFTAKRGWDLRCRYTAASLGRWPGNLPVLSCSLPLQARPQDASAFLRGLLPEGAHLQSMASLAGGSDAVVGQGNAYQSLFFVGFLLFLITLGLNIAATRIVRRVRQKY